MGVDHRRVEAYLPKTKVISEKERLVVEQEAKEDNSEAEEVLRTSEEKEADKVEGNAIEIETTETIKSGRATGNEKEVNSEEQDIGRVIELDQVCSQIVLETADDSTEESEEEAVKWPKIW